MIPYQVVHQSFIWIHDHGFTFTCGDILYKIEKSSLKVNLSVCLFETLVSLWKWSTLARKSCFLINTHLCYSRTPLHLCVNNLQNLEVSYVLVEYGARIEENDFEGIRPVDLRLVSFFVWCNFLQKAYSINPLSANSTKWSNTLKQFVGNTVRDQTRSDLAESSR